MIKNIFITAFRLIIKNKALNLSNIFGLIAGLTVSIIMLLYVNFEHSYDKFNDNYNQIYRIQANWFEGKKLVDKWAYIGPGIGPVIKQDFPEVKEIVRVCPSESFSVTNGTSKFRCENTLAVDSSFFKVFSYQFLNGSSDKAMSEPNSAVITESLAKKLFGNIDVINKPLDIYCKRGKVGIIITGVLKDIPGNSHLKFDLLVNFSVETKLRGEWFNTDWGFSRVFTYLLLTSGSDPQTLDSKFPAFIKKHKGETMNYLQLVLQPLSEIHLHSNLSFDTKNGNALITNLLLIGALVVLLFSWINYANINITQSLRRAKEIGVKKISGGQRKHFVLQFFFESLLQNVIAAIASFLIIKITIPYLDNLTGIGFQLTNINIYLFFGSLLLMILTGSILSGIYPAFYLSGINSITYLKGNFVHSKKGIVIRRFLTIFQFVIAIVLIICSVTFYRQIDFMMKYDVGMDLDNKIIVRAPIINYANSKDNYNNNISAFKNEIEGKYNIDYFISSFTLPGQNNPINTISNPTAGEKLKLFDACQNMVDYEYFKGFNITFLSGRPFSKDFPTDNNMVIINESSCKLLGFASPGEAINKKLLLGDQQKMIIGVTRDFNHQSLKKERMPFVFELEEIGKYFYTIKYHNTDRQEIIPIIKKVWEKYFPDDPLDYYFLKDDYYQQYKPEIIFKKTFGIFTVISILIACLGLFALSSNILKDRTKEIGIRRVNGARYYEIMVMLLKSFSSWITIAYVIACPIAYYIIDNWLQNYAYRIKINFWIFTMAGFIILIITIVTLSWQSWRAASRNPVEALRYE